MKRRATTQKSPKTFKKRKTTVSKGYQVGHTHPRVPKQELKAFDLALTNTQMNAPGTPPVAQVVNAMLLGSDYFNRIGRKTYMKSLHFTGWIYPAATSAADYGRIVVLYDAQPNTALPAWNLTFTDANAAGAAEILSGLNLNQRERFQILADERFQLPSNSFAATVVTNVGPVDGSQHLKFDRFLKLKGLETIYNATDGGTIADIVTGSLIIFFFSGLGNWLCSWQTRLRYYD